MVIRILHIILSLLLTFHLFSQGFEQQLKYKLSTTLNESDLSKTLSDSIIQTFIHGQYIYQDIYFDNAQQSLFNNFLSLRMRRRIIDDSLKSYSFQLKNEMLEHGALRMEIDETELDFYRIKKGSQTLVLSDLLDSIFDSNDISESSDYLELLYSWIQSKMDGAIAPFQALRKLYPSIFESIKTDPVKAVCLGESRRIRGHVYLLSNELIPYNYRAISDRTPYFLENPSFNWLFEISYDNSVFKTLSDHPKEFQITELEVENKYFEQSIAEVWIKQFEKLMSQRMDFHSNLDSKYRQVILLNSNQ